MGKKHASQYANFGSLLNFNMEDSLLLLKIAKEYYQAMSGLFACV